MDASTGSVDVIVVGAGLAGLAAASELERAGRSVLVLEAAGEVGGRTRSRLLGGRVVDIGGELVGHSYRRIRHLARDLGLHLEPTLTLPRLRLDPDLAGIAGPRAVVELLTLERRLRVLSGALDPARPWTHPTADHLDHISLAGWLGDLDPSPPVRRLIEICAQAFTTAEARDLSLLHVLLWLRPGRGLSTALRETRWRIREGAQEITRRLSRRLRRPVMLHAPVQQVSQQHDGVRVTTRDGGSWYARRAAVCTPLATTHRIDFDPELPLAARLLNAEVTAPPITKLTVVPQVPARAALVVGDPTLPLVSLSRHHGIGFAYGHDADMPAERLLRLLLSTLRLQAPQPHHAEAWHRDPFIGGGYVAHPPGHLTRHGPALRAPAGRIHFAGGDRSTWPGTMEGAAEDGHRVATEILKARL